MNMETAVFWDVTPRSLIEKYRRFGGTRCLSPVFAVKMPLAVGTLLLQAALRHVRVHLP
jgi:hypothetical protein